MAALTIPNTIADGQDVLGTPLAENFEAIRAFVNASVMHLDGGTQMTGPLQLSDGNNAASAAYVDSAVAAVGPVGTIVQYAGSAAPSAIWQLARGQEVSRSTYAALFAVVGTTYGAGNGVTTFNLPNLQGRIPVALNPSDPKFDALNEQGGSYDAVVPSHSHTVSGTAVAVGDHTHSTGIPAGTSGHKAGTQHAHAAGTSLDFQELSTVTGGAGGHAHSVTGTAATTGVSVTDANIQPYIVVNYLIKVA